MVWSIWACTSESDITEVFWTTEHQKQASGYLLLLYFGHLSCDIVVVKLNYSTPSHEKKIENYYLWKRFLLFQEYRLFLNLIHAMCSLWYSLCRAVAILSKNLNPVTIKHVMGLRFLLKMAAALHSEYERIWVNMSEYVRLWRGCDFNTLVVRLSNYLNELLLYLINILIPHAC